MISQDMARLRGGVLSMRRDRGSLMKALLRDTKARRKAVAQLCVEFSHSRAMMAKRTKDARLVFLGEMKRSVGAQLKTTRDDIAGARSAWAGKAF